MVIHKCAFVCVFLINESVMVEEWGEYDRGLTVIRDLWDFNYQRYGNTHDKWVLIDDCMGLY